MFSTRGESDYVQNEVTKAVWDDRNQYRNNVLSIENRNADFKKIGIIYFLGAKAAQIEYMTGSALLSQGGPSDVHKTRNNNHVFLIESNDKFII